MPATSSNLNDRFSVGPQRVLSTPSASPSLTPPDRPPTKRPRFRSTPSSCVSATPSNSTDLTSSADVDSARRASTLRVLNVWAQLAERYNKRLDEDDILDLYSGTIVKDRGVCRAASREYHFGHIAHPGGDQDPEGDQDQEESEQDEDDDELNGLPLSEATDDDAPISKKELLRGVPPLSVTTDAEDLREFLEAEKRRRELAGDEEDEDLPLDRLFAMRKALEEQSQEETATTTPANGEASTNRTSEPQVDDTLRRPSRVPPSDDESEDELGVWVHDESTAVHPVTRVESDPETHEHDERPEVIELTDSSDSDREFEALLTRPARFVRPPVPPQEVKQPLYSPPDSGRGRSKSRPRPTPKIKTTVEVTPKSEGRPRSPLMLQKPQVALSRRDKGSVLNETDTDGTDDDASTREVIRLISSAHRGKGKEVQTSVDDNRQEKTPKSLGVAARGRKRKRIVSSTSGGPLSPSPDQKKSARRPRENQTSRSLDVLPQPDGPEQTLIQDPSTSLRTKPTSPRRLRAFSVSKVQRPTSSASAYRSPEPELIQPTSHIHNSNMALPLDSPIPVTHSYPQQDPLSMFSSPNQATPGPSQHSHLPPPLNPAQTQQAHYLLAQAMQQLSYLLSVVPPYHAYPPSPRQAWHPQPQPHPPPPLAICSTPIASHTHGIHPYHTPSSTMSHSELPPSSPVSPVERSRDRGRSKSHARRVSFKNSDEIPASRQHSVPPEIHHSEQKKRTQILEGKREGKDKAADDAFWEDREGPRGRTPGPPNRKKRDASRGRSLNRR